MATREERLQKTLNAKEKSEKRRGYNTTPLERPDIEYTVLHPDTTQVFRLVGEAPYKETREKPTDMKFVKRSLCKCEDGSYLNVVWDEDPKGALNQLYYFITKGKWENDASGKSRRIYEHQGCELLRYVNTNGGNTSPYETGWQPKVSVLANAIDRLDNWCAENNHTKMIAWSQTESKGNMYYQAGLSSGAFKEIFTILLTETGKMHDEMDIIFHKYSQANKPDDTTYYSIYSHMDREKLINIQKTKKWNDVTENIVEDIFLTEAEQNYELYNLDDIAFISKVTPAGVIHSKMSSFFKKVDKKYGKNFYEMLLEAKEIETEKWRAERDVSESTSANTTYSTEKVEESEAPATRTKTQTQTTEVKDFWPQIESNSNLKGIPKLTDGDRKEISGYDATKEILLFTDTNLEACKDCGKPFPLTILTCPYCGMEYAEDVQE